MEERFKLTVVFMVMLSLFSFNENQSLALNDEGLALLMLRGRVVSDPFGALSNWKGDDGVIGHCSWFGVECSNGRVISLNLKDLCLKGTLPPEIGKLTSIKSIILRNNSFSGEIPKEIQQLEELEILDLGYNNFSGHFPSDLTNNPSLIVLLLDNNDYLGYLTPEVYKLKTISEFRANKEQPAGATIRSSFWHIIQHRYIADWGRLLKIANVGNTHITKEEDDNGSVTLSPSSLPSLLPPDSPLSVPPSKLPSNSPSASTLSPLKSSPSQYPLSSFLTPEHSPSPVGAPTPGLSIEANPPSVSIPPQSNWAPAPSPSPSSSPEKTKNSISKSNLIIIWSIVGSLSFLILASGIAFAFFKSSKVVMVKPWVTGLSGQLQKAFVTGVPNLKRSEIVVACEEFSNIIETLEDATVYKGTLSSGVEIAVVSTSMTSKNWSKYMESQFRKKIETLSRVNHKNFVNLIGFCEEKKPFTRMMVFEYAPNGTLFEHLHITESEHLDWGMRRRIAMGIAFSLEHMHQLTPPLALRNLLSSSVYLTEDYAAKVSDLSFWNEMAATRKDSAATKLWEESLTNIKGNVYSFGMLLFELITGRIPYIVDNGLLIRDWVLEYLRMQPLRDLVDPTLDPLQLEETEKWSQVIKECMHPNPKERPTMREVAAKLKEITGIKADGARPRLSPLWWAELEILSTDSS